MILKKQLLTIGIAAFLSAVALHSPAQAQPVSACDPQYMDALESRAWLEAQREITQNQNLISKPDSVLEYTCFNSFLNHLSDNISVNGVRRPFSQTNHWGGPPAGLSATSTAQTLDQMVRVAMTSYLTANFNHRYLGDRLGSRYAGTATPVNGNLYNCDEMARVWEQARCQNFMQRPGQDGFFDFPWYQDNDPRDLPFSMNACQPPSGPIGSAMNSAFNEEEQFFTMANDNPFTDGTPYRQDPVETHMDRITPGQCSNNNYIRTGITVQRADISGGYPEIICTNPGCSQSGTGTSCSANVSAPNAGGGNNNQP